MFRLAWRAESVQFAAPKPRTAGIFTNPAIHRRAQQYTWVATGVFHDPRLLQAFSQQVEHWNQRIRTSLEPLERLKARPPGRRRLVCRPTTRALVGWCKCPTRNPDMTALTLIQTVNLDPGKLPSEFVCLRPRLTSFVRC